MWQTARAFGTLYLWSEQNVESGVHTLTNDLSEDFLWTKKLKEPLRVHQSITNDKTKAIQWQKRILSWRNSGHCSNTLLLIGPVRSRSVGTMQVFAYFSFLERVEKRLKCKRGTYLKPPRQYWQISKQNDSLELQQLWVAFRTIQSP